MMRIGIGLFYVLAIGAGPVAAKGRCPDPQIDCLGIFRTCFFPSQICDGHSECRTRIDEDFCECFSDDNCDPGHECQNLYPILGKKCVEKKTCQKGMRLDGAKHCVDVNECKEGTHNCSRDQFCVNTPGSYECQCRVPGFIFNESTRQCDDIDECLQGSLCDPPGQCQNTKGSYNCTCPEHYVQFPKPAGKGFFCSEKDYCEEVACAAPLKCQNDGHGGSSCICPEVTHEMLNETCVDRDECQGPNLCQRIFGGSLCVNLNGSYACLDSSVSTGDELIVPISQDRGDLKVFVHHRRNESCESGSCGRNQICVQGVCLCIEGYSFANESAACIDVDECSTGQDDCPPRLKCENRLGGFVCDCPDGYQETVVGPDNSTTTRYDTIGCADIDECAMDLHTCAFTCRNTRGSYECGCRAGYVSDRTKRVCLPLGGSSELLVAMFGRFYLAEMNLESGNLEFEPLPMSCDVRASTIFTYHQTRSEVYFVSEDLTSIYRSLLNDSCVQVISGREQISTLGLDWVYAKIYWTDHIGVMVSELNGEHVKTLLGFEASISDLIVNPFNGWMLFTSEGQLWRVGLDGTHMSRAFDVDANVTSLAFDVEESNIAIQTDSKLLLCPEYFTVSHDCTDLPYPTEDTNGTLSLVDMFVDFTVLEDDAGTLTLASRNGKNVLRLVANHSTFESLRGRILHTMKQPAGGHKCHLQCSHLCVNSPSVVRFACLCPDLDSRGGGGGDDDCAPFISQNVQQAGPGMSSFSIVMFVSGLSMVVIGSTCVGYSIYLTHGAGGGGAGGGSSGAVKCRQANSANGRNSGVEETQMSLSSFSDSCDSRLDHRHLVKNAAPLDVVTSSRDCPIYREHF